MLSFRASHRICKKPEEQLSFISGASSMELQSTQRTKSLNETWAANDRSVGCLSLFSFHFCCQVAQMLLSSFSTSAFPVSQNTIQQVKKG